MAIEIVDLPSYKMVDLSSSFFVNVYQRVVTQLEGIILVRGLSRYTN